MNVTPRQLLAGVRHMVIKLGTQLLSNASGIDAPYLAAMATQIAELRRRGVRVTVVSSGAVGAGLAELNLPKRPTDLGKLQAVAAVGQRRLMDAWAGAFAPHQLKVAQILLTRDDIDARTRFLNLRNTIHAVHEFGAVPIINENDTVSTDEMIKITFGDNDILSALVTQALRADLLVLLSVVDGVLDEAGRPVRLVQTPDDAKPLVRVEKSALGKGGMSSKLQAARMVTDSGEAMIVAHGRMENLLPRLIDGEELGTLFVPGHKRRPSRVRWIGSARPAGSIVVDAGAVAAVGHRNKSLLPAGVVAVQGEFDRGDVVAIVGPDGTCIARGLSNYASEDVLLIRGKKTAELRTLLAERAYDEVIHRDNLLLEKPPADA